MHLKRPQRIVVVGRDEDHRALYSDQFQHFESIQLRHLNIEEHQVRLIFRVAFTASNPFAHSATIWTLR